MSATTTGPSFPRRIERVCFHNIGTPGPELDGFDGLIRRSPTMVEVSRLLRRGLRLSGSDDRTVSTSPF
jgi:hypothetical protein